MPPGAGVSGQRPSILVTGATGTLGFEVVNQLRNSGLAEITRTSRRGAEGEGAIAWDMRQPAPPSVVRRWDAIIHCAASTRWNATPDEAWSANVETTHALANLVSDDTVVVHVSTAFVRRADTDEYDVSESGISQYRNPYEWSKAAAERFVRDTLPNVRVVRPPLILGRRTDGFIHRFAGTYSLISALTSGMAAAIVGHPTSRIEVAPVDEVAAVVVGAAFDRVRQPGVEIVAAGDEALTLRELVEAAIEELNEFRREHHVADLDAPPFIEPERWERFFRPFAAEVLTRRQLQALEILDAFHVYTTDGVLFRPTVPVVDAQSVIRRSVRYWAEQHRRPALRTPRDWTAGPSR